MVSGMFACIDVDYRPDPSAIGREQAIAACVEFREWTDAVALAEHVRRIPEVEPYVSGQFYRRELPCALAVLADLATPPAMIVIDGYVHLDQSRPGFGVYLHRELGEQTPIIGVAKNRFRNHLGSNPAAIELLRGESKRPLFVTAIGIEAREAAEHIRAMHGPSRLPTLLKRVDSLCRQGLNPPRA